MCMRTPNPTHPMHTPPSPCHPQAPTPYPMNFFCETVPQTPKTKPSQPPGPASIGPCVSPRRSQSNTIYKMATIKEKKGKKETKELSPEEKKAKAEMLALKSEEAKKKKAAASKARLLQIKHVEDKYSKDNLRTINDRWRKIMRAAKTAELHKDIESFSDSYDCEVKRKDKMIATLMQHLAEAEQQRQTAFSKHLQIVDGLIDLHHTRMKDMEEEFQDCLQKLEKSFESERQHIETVHEREKKELNDMIHAMENECKEAENDLRQEFEASREEIKNKNTEEYNVLKISLERSVEDLERKIEETHQAYLESTETKTQTFKRMMEKDKVTARLIEQRMRKLLHLHESIAYRRAKIATDSREWESRNKAMRDQKDEMNKHYQDLKRKISKLRYEKHGQLKAISKISEEVRSGLNSKLQMAEHILKLSRLNNKLEMEQENIFPFDPLHCSNTLCSNLRGQDNLASPLKIKQESNKSQSTPSEDKLNKASPNEDDHGSQDIVTLPFATDECGKEVEEFEYLSRFHQKYNKVMLDKIALENQKRELSSEVSSMRISLRHLLDGCTGSDNETLKKLKCLLNDKTYALKKSPMPHTMNDIIRSMKNSVQDLEEKCGVVAA